MTSRFAINPRVLQTLAPAILEARIWLENYNGDKGAALDLSQAAPPYPPPPALLDRLSEAAGDAGVSRYGPVQGEFELRAAYAEHASMLYDAAISPDRVAITSGCNQAFVIAAMLVAQRGDAIILPVPYYFNHAMTLDMLDVEARLLHCDAASAFVPGVDDIRRLIDEKVRAVVLVTPNNPTGAIYPPETLQAIATLCHERGVWLIIDETYRDFLPERSQKPHALFESDLRDGVIGLYSFSKSLAIPGHRLGAMIYPPALAEQALKIHDCIQICPARAGQIAVTWGLKNLELWRRDRTREMTAKAGLFQSVMNSAAGWEIESIGAYFAYVRHPFEGTSSREIARRLAAENGLLMIPGAFFGPDQDRYLRVSFGNLNADTLDGLHERFRLT